MKLSRGEGTPRYQYPGDEMYSLQAHNDVKDRSRNRECGQHNVYMNGQSRRLDTIGMRVFFVLRFAFLKVL